MFVAVAVLLIINGAACTVHTAKLNFVKK